MKCEYWSIDYGKKHKLGEPTPIKHCQNEGAAYFCCDFIDALVCKECACRCYKSCSPMSEEDIKEFLEAREERRRRWDEKNKVDKK